MTIAMPDSIVPANMPKGYKAYLAYVDGARSKDADQVRAMFAGTEILTLTVLGGGAKADGCDMEPGDLSPESAAEWLHLAIIAGQSRPVLYASRDAVPGVLDLLGDAHVSRGQIRILSAHYGLGQHICSPAACGATFTADGTQWTDSFATGGPNGAVIDMSLLADGFFGTPTPPTTVNWTEKIMQQLPIVKQGQTGGAVKTVQALCNIFGTLKIDGTFGPLTLNAVKQIQHAHGLTVDGIVGPLTWPVLLGV